MRRREFITLLGGTAASWPFAAGAQQPQQMRRIGMLMTTREDDVEVQCRKAGPAQGGRFALSPSHWQRNCVL
jgi:hypothetical protein